MGKLVVEGNLNVEKVVVLKGFDIDWRKMLSAFCRRRIQYD